MAYLTDRKRVSGLGSAHGGTAQHWTMTVTSVALLILTPFFLGIIGSALGSEHADVIATLGKPVPALIVAAYLVVGAHHLRYGMQTLLEDYTHGLTKKVSIIATTIICYGLAAGGLVALMQIAL
ncbi:succinate dehydrogenase, hydrophobic membrane anchor protein [Rhodobacteraceae bacterium N5(2021)]|uniref:Succinate dehydrogenase hydrophobic membrane anchor subunit n=1 Tax=Gymnodinialimonas phycosphaerae TaxID=2841589 RepID=A0A975TTU0_9RHOB|nr:succinate dehydrogenase, hydrophobic membrane anchor protein [Gymnodinialimonas phycosphaerae]MBY4894876.1 succinate dehydrogenase, hydrophobic membrane anchor protein [Gymnodinialimonas phycosphaerae]